MSRAHDHQLSAALDSEMSAVASAFSSALLMLASSIPIAWQWSCAACHVIFWSMSTKLAGGGDGGRGGDPSMDSQMNACAVSHEESSHSPS